MILKSLLKISIRFTFKMSYLKKLYQIILDLQNEQSWALPRSYITTLLLWLLIIIILFICMLVYIIRPTYEKSSLLCIWTYFMWVSVCASKFSLTKQQQGSFIYVHPNPPILEREENSIQLPTMIYFNIFSLLLSIWGGCAVIN